jgi:hypothetical protein
MALAFSKRRGDRWERDLCQNRSIRDTSSTHVFEAPHTYLIWLLFCKFTGTGDLPSPRAKLIGSIASCREFAICGCRFVKQRFDCSAVFRPQRRQLSVENDTQAMRSDSPIALAQARKVWSTFTSWSSFTSVLAASGFRPARLAATEPPITLFRCGDIFVPRGDSPELRLQQEFWRIPLRKYVRRLKWGRISRSFYLLSRKPLYSPAKSIGWPSCISAPKRS